MHRKTFLRQAAITLPAAMLAPELLFSAGSSPAAQASVHEMIIIADPSAKAGIIASASNAVTVMTSNVTGISFTAGQWQVSLAGGSSYLTQKLVVNAPGCEVKRENALNITSLAKHQEICFGQNRNLKAAKRQEKQHTPQVWMQSHDKMDDLIFGAFVSKQRPVLLYID